MKRAHFQRLIEDWQSDARLYRCEPPLEGHEYVIVSGASAMFSGPETYIFAADADGEVSNWRELEGSFRGDIDHAAALRAAGYEIADGKEAGT